MLNKRGEKMPKLYNGYEIEEFDIIDSTSTLLTERAKNGAKDKSVIIAREQSAGRGRYGRKFYSPKGAGLYMSLLIRKRLPMELAMLLTPMTACAVSRAIEKVTDVRCGVKWVNDIYIDGKKAAGILTETKFDFESKVLEYAVIGIGINLAPPDGGFEDEIAQIATAISDRYDEAMREALIKEILNQLDIYLYKLGSKELMEEYRRRSIILGKDIEIRSLTGDRPARALDIDNNGNLIVESSLGYETLSSGEVSIRMK